MEVIVFPGEYERYHTLLNEESIYLWMHKLKMTMSVRLWIGEIMRNHHY